MVSSAVNVDTHQGYDSGEYRCRVTTYSGGVDYHGIERRRTKVNSEGGDTKDPHYQ